jgi:hypothetical protein
MKTYEADFEMQIQVEIENPEAVTAYFIDGNWREVFWDIDDLEDFVSSFAHAFQATPEYLRDGLFLKEVEGFGIYSRKPGEKGYQLSADGVLEIGSAIGVTVDDLEVAFVTERTDG